MLFSHVKIYNVFVQKLTWYFIDVYIIKFFLMCLPTQALSFLKVFFPCTTSGLVTLGHSYVIFHCIIMHLNWIFTDTVAKYFAP